MITGMELALLEMKLAAIRLTQHLAIGREQIEAHKAHAEATTRLANAYRAQAEARFTKS